MYGVDRLPAYNPPRKLTLRQMNRLPRYNPVNTADPRRLQLPVDEAGIGGVNPDRLPQYNPPAATEETGATGKPEATTLRRPDRLPQYNKPPTYSETANQHYQHLLNSPVEDQNGRFRCRASLCHASRRSLCRRCVKAGRMQAAKAH